MGIFSNFSSVNLEVTSLSFLFVLFPIFLIAFYASPYRARPTVLLCLSLIFYTLAEPSGIFALLLSVFIDYTVLLAMERFYDKRRLKQGLILFSVLKGIFFIILASVSDYNGFYFSFGLAVVTVSGVSCMIDLYKGRINNVGSLVHFGLYCTFFPRLYAGPLMPYKDFTAKLHHMSVPKAEIAKHAQTFLSGIFKTAILGSAMFTLHRQVAALTSVTTLSAWMQVITIAFALYYVLSGLCDITMGIGGLFGIKIPQNFYYPYQSRNMQDFSERFNRTVIVFIREDVLPLIQGDRKSKAGDVLCTLLIGMLFGTWFGWDVNNIVWGVYLALFVVLERHVFKKAMDFFPTLFSRIATLIVVLTGFSLFLKPTVSSGLSLIGSLYSFSSLYNESILNIITSNWLLLAVCILFSTNAANLLIGVLDKYAPRLTHAVHIAISAGLLCLILSFSL